jgi:hypothetical protein
MLSIGPGAPRSSPSQDIRVGDKFPAELVMYITDTASQKSSQSRLQGREADLSFQQVCNRAIENEPRLRKECRSRSHARS